MRVLAAMNLRKMRQNRSECNKSNSQQFCPTCVHLIGYLQYDNRQILVDRMYIDYYSLLVCCITIRYCSIIKYYNYYEYIPSSILSFKTIMIYIYNNTLIYSINYIRLDCLFKIYLYICGVSFRDTIMA